MLDIFQTVVAKAAGITSDSKLASVFSGRADLMELTENSHEASLRPKNYGGLSYSERAGLACRMAKLNNDQVLATHYEGLFGDGSQALSDPAFDGGSDSRLRAIIRHTDLITTNPKTAVAGDVAALQSVGMNDPDIVRLSQLIAFVSYQIRVVQSLRLMAEVA
ncbi:MAG: hypothetical protein CL902_10125 [Dehalococcoidia bacterium]|nr:hypothetical protein [Dehalococcoidia bacterium]